MSPSSFLNLTIILLLSTIPIPASASRRHIIKIPSSIPRPAGLSYDPAAQHFVVFSSSRPIISSVSDAGVTETIISDSLASSVCSISIDDRRRRLLVALRGPDAIAAFDLRSARPHRRIFSSPLPSSPGAIAVDPRTGFAFAAGSDGGLIWRVGLDGEISDFSESEVYGGEGLAAVAHARNGFLLAVQGKMGRIFKVDEKSGAAREVIGRNWNPAPETKGIGLMSDGNAVVVCERGVRMVKGFDGWAEAAVTGEVRVEGGKRFEGVATREGKKAYVLVREEEEEEGGELGGRIEEVEWEEEGDLLWLMVMIGFGLAYFLYWRFQMRQLVSNMNKKQA